MIQLSQKIVYQMRQQVFNRLTELPVGYFDTHQTGDIVSRISYDIDTVNASSPTTWCRSPPASSRWWAPS